MSSKRKEEEEIPAVEGQKSTKRFVKVVVRKGLRSKVDRRRGRYKVKTKAQKEAERKAKEKKAKRDAKKALKNSPEYNLLLKQFQELQKKLLENETKEKKISSSGRYSGPTRGVEKAFAPQSGTSKVDVEKLLKEQQEKLQKELEEFKKSFTSEFLKQKKKDEERTKKQLEEQGEGVITSSNYYDDDDDDDDYTATSRTITKEGVLKKKGSRFAEEYSNKERNENRNPSAVNRRTTQTQRTPTPQPEPEPTLQPIVETPQPTPQPIVEIDEIPSNVVSFEDEIQPTPEDLVIPAPLESSSAPLESTPLPSKKVLSEIPRPDLSLNISRKSPQQLQLEHITSARQEPTETKRIEEDVEQIKSELEEQRKSKLEEKRISDIDRFEKQKLDKIDEVLKDIVDEDDVQESKEIDEMIKQQAKDRKVDRAIGPINEREQLRRGRTLQQTKVVDLTEDERKDIAEKRIEKVRKIKEGKEKITQLEKEAEETSLNQEKLRKQIKKLESNVKGKQIKEGKAKAKQKREEEQELQLALQTEEEQINVKYEISIIEKKKQDTKRKKALEELQTDKLITFFTLPTQTLLKNKNFKTLADKKIIETELQRINLKQYQKSKIQKFMTSNNEFYKLQKKSEKLKKKLDEL